MLTGVSGDAVSAFAEAPCLGAALAADVAAFFVESGPGYLISIATMATRPQTSASGATSWSTVAFGATFIVSTLRMNESLASATACTTTVQARRRVQIAMTPNVWRVELVITIPCADTAIDPGLVRCCAAAGAALKDLVAISNETNPIALPVFSAAAAASGTLIAGSSAILGFISDTPQVAARGEAVDIACAALTVVAAAAGPVTNSLLVVGASAVVALAATLCILVALCLCAKRRRNRRSRERQERSTALHASHVRQEHNNPLVSMRRKGGAAVLNSLGGGVLAHAEQPRPRSLSTRPALDIGFVGDAAVTELPPDGGLQELLESASTASRRFSQRFGGASSSSLVVLHGAAADGLSIDRSSFAPSVLAGGMKGSRSPATRQRTLSGRGVPSPMTPLVSTSPTHSASSAVASGDGMNTIDVGFTGWCDSEKDGRSVDLILSAADGIQNPLAVAAAAARQARQPVAHSLRMTDHHTMTVAIDTREAAPGAMPQLIVDSLMTRQHHQPAPPSGRKSVASARIVDLAFGATGWTDADPFARHIGGDASVTTEDDALRSVAYEARLSSKIQAGGLDFQIEANPLAFAASRHRRGATATGTSAYAACDAASLATPPRNGHRSDHADLAFGATGWTGSDPVAVSPLEGAVRAASLIGHRASEVETNSKSTTKRPASTNVGSEVTLMTNPLTLAAVGVRHPLA